jgi:hypothetical protein
MRTEGRGARRHAPHPRHSGRPGRTPRATRQDRGWRSLRRPACMLLGDRQAPSRPLRRTAAWEPGHVQRGGTARWGGFVRQSAGFDLLRTVRLRMYQGWGKNHLIRHTRTSHARTLGLGWHVSTCTCGRGRRPARSHASHVTTEQPLQENRRPTIGDTPHEPQRDDSSTSALCIHGFVFVVGGRVFVVRRCRHQRPISCRSENDRQIKRLPSTTHRAPVAPHAPLLLPAHREHLQPHAPQQGRPSPRPQHHHQLELVLGAEARTLCGRAGEV